MIRRRLGMGDKLNAILEADGIVPDYIDGISFFFSPSYLSVFNSDIAV